MALSRTDLLGQLSGASGNFGTGAFTTSSFSPPSNSLLVVAVLAIENAATSTSFLAELTIASSNGLTFTNRVETEASPTAFGLAIRIWTAPVTTGTSMTLTLDCGTRSIGTYATSVVAYTGYDTGTPVGGTGSNFHDGITGTPTAASLTLNASPAATSEVFGAAGMDKSSANATPGAAFTEIHDLFNSDWGGLETEIRTGSTSTTVDWVDLIPGGGTLFNYGVVGLAVNVASGGADPGVPPLVIQAPGLMVPNGLPTPWLGTEDTAGAVTEVATPAGASGTGPTATTSGTATVTGTPGAVLGAAGVTAPTGTTSVATSPLVAVGNGTTPTISASATVTALPGGTLAGSGTQTFAGTATSTATPGLSMAGGPTTAPTGTTTVTVSPSDAIGLAGSTTAAATTLQATLPSGAQGGSGSQATAGTSTVTTTPRLALGAAGTTTQPGAASVATSPSTSVGAGVLTTATATTLQSATPSGCVGGAGRVTLTAAAAVTATPSTASGQGSTAVFTAAATATAPPGGGRGAATSTVAAITVYAVIGQALARGGTQIDAIQIASRGSMNPMERQAAQMTPKTRGAPGMSPVDR